VRVIGTRWAVSFADLCLLLLGFLIIAQAKPDPAKLAAGIRSQAGLAARTETSFAAVRMFEPGEAVLTIAGRREIAAFAARAGKTRIRLQSSGADRATTRLDGWELAAARTAAVARALVAEGIAEDRLLLSIDRADNHAQRLSLVAE
jgi:hypothetical protein